MIPFDSSPENYLAEVAGDMALGFAHGKGVMDRLMQLALGILPFDGVTVLVYGDQGDPWVSSQPRILGDVNQLLMTHVDSRTEAGTILEIAGLKIRLDSGAPLNGCHVQPLRAADQSLRGVFAGFRQDIDPLPPQSNTVMAQIARVFEDELNLMSIGVRDHLTGLFNRRFFDEMANREWRRAKREALPVSVLVADVDHFKLFNDTYGHHEGDRALINVAQCMSGTFRRAADLLARYGGEEFAAILPQTDEDGGFRAAERLCAAVAALEIPHSRSPTGYLTISVGVATAGRETPEGSDLTGFTKAADQALYVAKQNGRARVEVARL